jgi:hypothetical protein
MGKAITQAFRIGGFSQIDSGARDYGMGVVRIDQRLLVVNPVAARWGRHALLRIKREEGTGGGPVYAMLRAIDPLDLPGEDDVLTLCLEYDDRLLLQVEKGETATLHLSKASVWGRYQYFRNHPNIVVRSYTRYTFLTGVFTTLLGATAWALFRKFGM